MEENMIEKLRNEQEVPYILQLVPREQLTQEQVLAFMDSPAFRANPERALYNTPVNQFSEEVILKFVKNYVGPRDSMMLAHILPAELVTPELALKIIDLTDAPVIVCVPPESRTDEVYKAAYTKNPLTICSIPKHKIKPAFYLDALTRIIEAAEAGTPYYDWYLSNNRCGFSVERLLDFAPDITAIPKKLMCRLACLDSDTLVVLERYGLFEPNRAGEFSAEAWELVEAATKGDCLTDGARKVIPFRMIQVAFAR